MIKYFICFIFLIAPVTFAQHSIERAEPPFWWKGMHNPELQIMIYGENVAELIPEIEYDGIAFKRTVLAENRNYLFIYLDIELDVTPGEFTIQFRNNENRVIDSINYRLLPRDKDAALRKGYDNSDVMYLITPDRFANGDTRVDLYKWTLAQNLDNSVMVIDSVTLHEALQKGKVANIEKDLSRVRKIREGYFVVSNIVVFKPLIQNLSFTKLKQVAFFSSYMKRGPDIFVYEFKL